VSDAREYFATPEPAPAPPAVTDPFAAPSPSAGSDARVAELTEDLQRVSAEFANYRRRVERDRQSDADAAVSKALSCVLPVLDDIDRADEHDELKGGFRAVAERLTQELSALGLSRFARAGDPFDPRIHDAVARLNVADVTEPICCDVLVPGYTYKGALVRPAHVAVAVPGPASPSESVAEGQDAADDDND
jgi:molecular chaperone GrpE